MLNNTRATLHNQHPETHTRERPPRAAGVVANAAWALSNLAHGDAIVPQLVQEGALRALKVARQAFGSKLPEHLAKPLAMATARLEATADQHASGESLAGINGDDGNGRRRPRPSVRRARAHRATPPS